MQIKSKREAWTDQHDVQESSDVITVAARCSRFLAAHLQPVRDCQRWCAQLYHWLMCMPAICGRLRMSMQIQCAVLARCQVRRASGAR